MNTTLRPEDIGNRVRTCGLILKWIFLHVKREKIRSHFSLCHNIATLSQYPFPFRLAVIYTLLEKRLTTMYRVENTGDQTLWFSIGGHPAFNCSLNQEGRKDCRLVFEKPETVNRLVNESGYLTGQEAPFLNDQSQEGKCRRSTS